MKITAMFSTIAAALVVVDKSFIAATTAPLRGSRDDAGLLGNANERSLLFTSITLDQIVSAFTPVLEASIRAALDANMDPTNVGLTFTQELDSVVLSETCTGSATVTYTLGDLTGFGTYVMDSMTAVQGTQNLDVSIFGGASFESAFNVEGSLPGGLENLIRAEITADACGTPLQQSVEGVLSTIGEPSLNFRVGLSGSTPGLLSFGSSSIDAMAFTDANVVAGPVEANIAFGDGIEVDLASVFETLFNNAIVDTIIPLITDILQTFLGGGITF